jgi:hypothetical protein
LPPPRTAKAPSLPVHLLQSPSWHASLTENGYAPPAKSLAADAFSSQTEGPHARRDLWRALLRLLIAFALCKAARGLPCRSVVLRAVGHEGPRLARCGRRRQSGGQRGSAGPSTPRIRAQSAHGTKLQAVQRAARLPPRWALTTHPTAAQCSRLRPRPTSRFGKATTRSV